jgi:20S proteasome subunit beta 3
MDKDELFETTSQAFLSALGRDASSGLGAMLFTISKDAVDVKTIKTRMD